MYIDILKESVKTQIKNLFLLKEAETTNPPNEKKENTPPINASPENPPINQTDPNMMNTDMGGMDMGMNPLYGMPQPLTLSEVGKIYTLKQIYYKLLAIKKILESNNNETLDKITDLINNAIEYFKLVISNKDLYKEKLDDIIINYYRFLEKIINLLADYFKKKNEIKLDQDKNKESKTFKNNEEEE